MTAALTGLRDQLRAQRAQLATQLESQLAGAQRAGRQDLSDFERRSLADVRALDDRITELQSEVDRAGTATGIAGRLGRQLGTASRLAPLGFDTEQLRRLQGAAQRGETCRLETRAPGFSSAESLLPPELFSVPIGAIHEARLLDSLPGIAMETASIEFIRHTSTTGAPAPTAEGAAKPELVFNVDQLTAHAVKLAAHNGLSYEIINDWPAFQSYCGSELYKQIIDVENAQLLTGDGTGLNMHGFYNTSGVLTHDAAADTGTTESAWDSLEKSIATLRTGPALGVANLLVLHPATWSAIRRVKDTMNRFMVAADPSSDQVDQAWGVPVLSTTANPAGRGLLLDTSKVGYVGVRESLSMRIGYTGTDFTQNILRTVAEERLVLCVTRPAACLAISNLPLA